MKSVRILYISNLPINTKTGGCVYIKRISDEIKSSEIISLINPKKLDETKNETNLNNRNKFHESLITINSIKKLLKASKDKDLVHFNPYTFTELFYALILRLFKRKVVTTLHGNLKNGCISNLKIKDKLENLRRYIVYKYFIKLSKLIFVLTNIQKSEVINNFKLQESEARRIKAIYNSIEEKDIVKIHKIKNKLLNCVYIGRLTKDKGFLDYLKLIDEFNKDKESSPIFRIAGGGPLSRKIPNYEKVIYYGEVDQSNIYNIYDSSDILILPSYSETFGLVILEAMARGLVVICSGLPAIREFFKDKINGFIFNPGDIKKIKELIINLKKNPRLIKSISKNNLRDIRNFTLKKQVNKYLNYYIGLIK